MDLAASASAETASWLYDKLPYVRAYLDGPKSLEELQGDVGKPEKGYEVHHIVEQTPAAREGHAREDIDGPDNLSIASPVPLAANSYASLMAKNWGPNATPKSAAFKNMNMVAGQLVTLLNYAGGPGVISSFSMYHPTTGATTKTNGFNGVISVYIDGEATPSLTYDIGGPLGWFQAGGAVWTANMNNAIVGGFSGGTALNSVFSNNFFPIPWRESIVGTFLPAFSINGATVITLNYVLGPYFPFKLCSSVTTYDQAVGAYGGSQYNLDGVSGSGAVQFLNVQGAGHIVFNWLGVYSSVNNDRSFMETNFGLYFDGKASATSLSQTSHALTVVGGNPDLDSSGGEDWFRTAFYGLTGQPVCNSPVCPYATSHPTGLELAHFCLDIQEPRWRPALSDQRSAAMGDGAALYRRKQRDR